MKNRRINKRREQVGRKNCRKMIEKWMSGGSGGAKNDEGQGIFPARSAIIPSVGFMTECLAQIIFDVFHRFDGGRPCWK